MEITRFLYNRFWDFLVGMNVHLGCFLIRWGVWMLISAGLLYFVWARMNSRSRFSQILTFIISTTIVFILPLENLKQIGMIYGFMIIVSVLAMICMPPRVAFFLTPIRGQQIKVMWVIYGLEVVLLLVQLIVM